LDWISTFEILIVDLGY